MNKFILRKPVPLPTDMEKLRMNVFTISGENFISLDEYKKETEETLSRLAYVIAHELQKENISEDEMQNIIEKYLFKYYVRAVFGYKEEGDDVA